MILMGRVAGGSSTEQSMILVPMNTPGLSVVRPLGKIYIFCVCIPVLV